MAGLSISWLAGAVMGRIAKPLPEVDLFLGVLFVGDLVSWEDMLAHNH